MPHKKWHFNFEKKGVCFYLLNNGGGVIWISGLYLIINGYS